MLVGLEIKRHRKEKKMFISQHGYITRTIEKFNMQDCKPNAVSADPNTILKEYIIQQAPPKYKI